jgi:hypothetical protein
LGSWRSARRTRKAPDRAQRRAVSVRSQLTPSGETAREGERWLPFALPLRGSRKASVGSASERDSGISAEPDARSDTNERSGAPETPGCATLDVIERALADALTRASVAGEWMVVAQLARELEARRLARTAPEVVDLAKARAKRGAS